MSFFSQSFEIGDDTLQKIELHTKSAKAGPEQVSKLFSNKPVTRSQSSKENSFEVIEESPNNKVVNYTTKDRLRNVSVKSNKRRLRKSKSDSKLIEISANVKIGSEQHQNTPSLLNDNFSAFFASQINFEDLADNNKDFKISNLDKVLKTDSKSTTSNKLQLKISEIKNSSNKEIDLNEIEELFDDSDFEPVQNNAENRILNKENLYTIDDSEDKNDDIHIQWEVSTFFNDIHTSSNTEEKIFNKFVESQNKSEKSYIDENYYDVDNITFVVDEPNKFEILSFKENIQEVLNIPTYKSIFDSNILFNDSQSIRNEVESQLELNISHQFSQQNLKTSTQILFKNKSNDIPTSCLMSQWGLPEKILNEYTNKGINKMFQWQVECLSNQKVLFESANLVYSAPTSAGKTLVSEILLIKNVLEKRKKGILILPFISVVREKMFYLQELLRPSKFRVEGFFGGYTPPGGFDNINIAVCTIEKANSIINRLLEQNKLSELGIIVLDEIHLISDPSRGYILELLISKILFACRKNNFKIQIITMSATLPNSKLLQKWLNAEHYSTNFRPVQLNEMIKVGTSIYDTSFNTIRNIDVNFLKELSVTDQDNVGQLCLETLLSACSVVVFCPSKDWCEKLCLTLAEIIYKLGKCKTELGKKTREIIELNKIEQMKIQFRNLPSGLDSCLEKCISYGCAFHHAGLTTDERDLIESNFKSGVLKIIIATSTLSSGVNLPARRVIIRTPLFGNKTMNPLTYRQMIGRAGRTGKDTLGESILICTDTNLKSGKELVCAKLNSISSCLDVNDSHLKRAILEIIASGVGNTINDLEQFIQCTLLWTEKKEFFEKNEKGDNKVLDCIQFLKEYEFIRLQNDEKTNENIYVSTMLGNACLSSSMPPGDGILLFSELQRARQSFVLDSELHAVYIVTPYSVCYQLHDIDWLLFLDLLEKLPVSMKRVAELVGIKEAFLVRAMRGQTKLDIKLVQIHKRFYTALALYELINEVPISKVSIKYKFSRGLLQSLQQTASTFAGIVTSFCNSLNWSMFSAIISQFKGRLYFGINHDLLDLMRIPNLTSTRARALYNNGITNLIELANSDVLSIENSLYNCFGFESEKKQENEDDYDLNQRNQIRNIYVTGKFDLTVRDAAKLLISDARRFLELEIGIENINWTRSSTVKTENNKSEETVKMNISEYDVKEISTHKRKNKSTKLKSNKIIVTEIGKERNIISNSDFFNDLKDDELTQHKTDNSVDEILSSQSFNYTRKLNTRSHSIKLNTQSINTILEIIDVNDKFQLDQISLEIENTIEIGFSIGIEKSEIIIPKIGEKLLMPNKNITNEVFKTSNWIIDDNLFISGIAIYTNFKTKKVYYINFQNENCEILMQCKVHFLNRIFQNENISVIICDAKEQILAIFKGNVEIDRSIRCKVMDPKVANWLLQTNFETTTFRKMMTLYAPELKTLTIFSDQKSNTFSIGMGYESNTSVKIRAAEESYLVAHILQNQRELLKNFSRFCLLKHFTEIEMPIQLSLLQMEKVGFPINSKKTNELCQNFDMYLKELEKEIFKLAGKPFNINSSREVAKAIGLKFKTSEKVSVTKEILEQINSSISILIQQYRKVGATLTKTILPIKENINNERIYGRNISFTTTGRITMHEPNLQNIARDFAITLKNPINISCRSVFGTKSNRCLISADFCQLELRILTHLSGDSRLLKIMLTDNDVFKLIASRWNSINEADVTEQMRHNTKQICYAIIYGMGIKTLATILKSDEETVVRFVEQFHNTYPGLRNYTETIIKETRETGYVETICGRKRFLPNINSEEFGIKGQAERQAVNTTIQGSASDITKMAILRMERNLKKYKTKLNINNQKDLNSSVDLVLHLHDELIYEVPLTKAQQVATILKFSMENCVKLKIPLRVKVKIGQSWGELKEIEI